MKDRKHNGWTNYATWRLNLEFFGDNYDMYCEDEDEINVSDIAIRLETDLENYIIENSKDGYVQDYAFAFVNDVNFYEIAEHVKEHYQNMCCDNCNERHYEISDFCSDECKKEYWLLADHPKG